MRTSPSLLGTKGCVSLVENGIRASLNAANHLQNTRSLLPARHGGDCEVRISFGVPPGLHTGLIWAQLQVNFSDLVSQSSVKEE